MPRMCMPPRTPKIYSNYSLFVHSVFLLDAVSLLIYIYSRTFLWEWKLFFLGFFVHIFFVGWGRIPREEICLSFGKTSLSPLSLTRVTGWNRRSWRNCGGKRLIAVSTICLHSLVHPALSSPSAT